MLASQNGHAEVVRALLAEGADPNVANPAGTTALGVARQRQRTDVVLLLEASGAR
jgi:ankyrin repeat protein